MNLRKNVFPCLFSVRNNKKFTRHERSGYETAKRKLTYYLFYQYGEKNSKNKKLDHVIFSIRL